MMVAKMPPVQGTRRVNGVGLQKISFKLTNNMFKKKYKNKKSPQIQTIVFISRNFPRIPGAGRMRVANKLEIFDCSKSRPKALTSIFLHKKKSMPNLVSYVTHPNHSARQQLIAPFSIGDAGGDAGPDISG